MRLSTFVTSAGLLALAFGLSFLLAPGPTLAQYGPRPDAIDVLMARFFGVALVHLGLVLLLARRVTDPAALRGLTLAGVVGSVVGLAVALWARLAGLVNALGWSTVAIYLVLLLGYGYFHFAEARGTAARRRVG